MVTTVLKEKILKFPQIKSNKIQNESKKEPVLLQCKINHTLYFRRSTTITQ